MNPHIEKALACLQKANYAGYFEEMNKVVPTPSPLKIKLTELRMQFVGNDTTWKFSQQLTDFAHLVNDELAQNQISNKKEETSIPTPMQDQTKTLYIIFVDLKGYGSNAGFNERLKQVTNFFFSLKDKHFSDGKEHFFKPLGDGILATGHSLVDMAQKALALRNDIKNHTWKQAGFPDNLNVRMALHVGEAIEHYNPDGTILEVSGTAVIQAARLEPYTMVGEVFCSQTYADLLAQDKSHSLATTYLGKYNLGKAHDTFELDIAVLFAESDRKIYEKLLAGECKEHLEQKTTSQAVEQSEITNHFDKGNVPPMQNVTYNVTINNEGGKIGQINNGGNVDNKGANFNF